MIFQSPPPDTDRLTRWKNSTKSTPRQEGTSFWTEVGFFNQQLHCAIAMRDIVTSILQCGATFLLRLVVVDDVVAEQCSLSSNEINWNVTFPGQRLSKATSLPHLQSSFSLGMVEPAAKRATPPVAANAGGGGGNADRTS